MPAVDAGGGADAALCTPASVVPVAVLGGDCRSPLLDAQASTTTASTALRTHLIVVETVAERELAVNPAEEEDDSYGTMRERRGSPRVKVVPSVAEERTAMSPPCASTICRTM